MKTLNSKAVLIINMLNDFVTGRFEMRKSQTYHPNLKKFTEHEQGLKYLEYVYNAETRPLMKS
jgi:hypothetical protein